MITGPWSRLCMVAGLIILLQPQELIRGADAAEEQIIPGDKASEFPFLGDWKGKFNSGGSSELCAQVIPRGSQQYLIRLLPTFDHRCPPLAEIEATADETSLSFAQEQWTGLLKGESFTGTGVFRGKPTDFTLTKVIRTPARLHAKPPAEAIVLFDGGALDHWESDGRGGVSEITWKQIDNFIRVWPPLKTHSFAGAMRTRDAWSDFQLHLEFRLPLIADALGQTRGNSGIIIEEFEFYEVQILDSYGLPGYWDETGAIYQKEAPKTNMCYPPGSWQSYDIEYHGPKFDENGALVSKARITIDLNGMRIHHEVELPYGDGAMKNRVKNLDSKAPGRITLQHHGDPVDFRNIWLLKLTK